MSSVFSLTQDTSGSGGALVKFSYLRKYVLVAFFSSIFSTQRLVQRYYIIFRIYLYIPSKVQVIDFFLFF